MEDILYEPLRKENAEKAIEQLRNSFFADEPLNKSLSLCKRGQPHKELEEFSLEVISQGLSFIATVKGSGEVVGVILNGTDERGKTNDKKLYKDQKLQKIFDFLGTVDKDVDFLNKFNVSSVLELKIVSVDHRYRGQGIAAQLYQHTESLARAKGFALLRADCTSFFSQQLFKKFGFIMLKEIVYDEYPSKEAPLFIVEPPHVSFKLMVKEINNENNKGT